MKFDIKHQFTLYFNGELISFVMFSKYILHFCKKKWVFTKFVNKIEKLNKTENTTLNLKLYDNFKCEIKIYIFIREKLVQKLHFFCCCKYQKHSRAKRNPRRTQFVQFQNSKLLWRYLSAHKFWITLYMSNRKRS